MDELDSLLKTKYGDTILPKDEIEKYFRNLIKIGQINEMPTKETLAVPMNLENLKKLADQLKSRFFFNNNAKETDKSGDASDNPKEDLRDESFLTCEEFNRLKERTRSIIGKRSREDNMEILRNVLNNYFKYEKMKMEKIDSRSGYGILCGLFIGLGCISALLLLYFFSSEEPY